LRDDLLHFVEGERAVCVHRGLDARVAEELLDEFGSVPGALEVSCDAVPEEVGADVSGVRIRVRDACGFPGLVHDVLYQAHAYYCAVSRNLARQGFVLATAIENESSANELGISLLHHR